MIPAANGRVPLVDVRAQTESLQPALSQAMQAVVERGDFILGEAVRAFEGEFAAYCGVRHAVGVDSGASALELALRALELGPGDEVIVQANTFIATAWAVIEVGARPVLTDCDPDGSTDPAAVKAALTSRTRAVIPVHLFGRICDIDAIGEIASNAGMSVIEDACQAHGAQWHGRRAGSFGRCAAFSFYPSKNLGAFGDGGMLVTSSDEVAASVRALRNYGQAAKYEHVRPALNRRLDTLQAAVLRVKLPHLDQWNRRRRELAQAYRALLDGLPVGLPAPQEDGRHVYHLFVIDTDDRDALRATLTARQIETGIHYPTPLHLQPALQSLGYRAGAFPQAERLARRSLSLPLYPEMLLEQVSRVAAGIRTHFQG